MVEESDVAADKAIREGTYEPGLDGNRELYKPIDDIYKTKIRALIEQYKKDNRLL